MPTPKPTPNPTGLAVAPVDPPPASGDAAGALETSVTGATSAVTVPLLKVVRTGAGSSGSAAADDTTADANAAGAALMESRTATVSSASGMSTSNEMMTPSLPSVAAPDACNPRLRVVVVTVVLRYSTLPRRSVMRRMWTVMTVALERRPGSTATMMRRSTTDTVSLLAVAKLRPRKVTDTGTVGTNQMGERLGVRVPDGDRVDVVEGDAGREAVADDEGDAPSDPDVDGDGDGEADVPVDVEGVDVAVPDADGGREPDGVRVVDAVLLDDGATDRDAVADGLAPTLGVAEGDDDTLGVGVRVPVPLPVPVPVPDGDAPVDRDAVGVGVAVAVVEGVVGVPATAGEPFAFTTATVYEGVLPDTRHRAYTPSGDGTVTDACSVAPTPKRGWDDAAAPPQPVACSTKTTSSPGLTRPDSVIVAPAPDAKPAMDDDSVGAPAPAAPSAVSDTAAGEVKLRTGRRWYIAHTSAAAPMGAADHDHDAYP